MPRPLNSPLSEFCPHVVRRDNMAMRGKGRCSKEESGLQLTDYLFPFSVSRGQSVKLLKYVLEIPHENLNQGISQ
jgi:hypothetical protein